MTVASLSGVEIDVDLSSAVASLVEKACQLLRDDSVRAIDAASAALQAAHDAGEPRLLAEAGLCMAQAHFNLGTLDAAFQHLQEAIRRWQSLADMDGESRARTLHSHCLQEMGQEKEALDEAMAALRLAEAAGSARSHANALMVLGFAYRSAGQAKAARATFADVVRASRKLADPLMHAKALCNVANTWGDAGFDLGEKGQHDEARRHFRTAYRLYARALALCRPLDNRRLESIVVGNMGLSLSDQGRHEEALALLQDLRERAVESGSRQIEEMAVRFIGETCVAAARGAEAVEALQVALAIAEETQRHESAMHSHKGLAQAFELCGNASKALFHHRRYHELYTQVQSEASDRVARAVAAQLETERAKALAQALRAQTLRLESENRQLAKQASELSRATLEDPLTGLLNRRGLDAEMAATPKQRRGDLPCAVALVDLDHFKRVNDRFSHLVGDEVLRAVGALIRQCCRDRDVPARFGGEEFAVVFRKTGVAEARIACERMREAIGCHDWQRIHPELAVTASIGVADTSEAEGEDLFAVADRRLYVAKHAGRDRVVATD